MRKVAVYQKKWFYWTVTAILAIQLVFNLTNLFDTWNYLKLIPFTIASLAFYLVVTKHRFSKITLQLGSFVILLALIIQMIFFIERSQGLALLGGLLFFTIFIALSVFILILTTRTIKIEEK